MKQFRKLLSPFPFNVSKINQVLNLVLIGFWLLIIFDFGHVNLILDACTLKNYYSFFALTSLATIFAIFSLFAFTQTSKDNFWKKNKKSEQTKIDFEKRGLK